VDDQLIFSASDLTGFLACWHLTRLECAAATGVPERPHRKDPLLELLSHRGIEHESRHLEILENQGLSVVEITHPASTRSALSDAAQQTSLP
jgi:hypothetical protein